MEVWWKKAWTKSLSRWKLLMDIADQYCARGKAAYHRLWTLHFRPMSHSDTVKARKDQYIWKYKPFRSQNEVSLPIVIEQLPTLRLRPKQINITKGRVRGPAVLLHHALCRLERANVLKIEDHFLSSFDMAALQVLDQCTTTTFLHSNPINDPKRRSTNMDRLAHHTIRHVFQTRSTPFLQQSQFPSSRN